MEHRSLVAVIGDAGISPATRGYELARETGRLIIDHGHRLVTGGLGGVMEAACRGAHESESYREGDTVGILPHLDPDTANAWVDIPIATGLGHGRNALVANSDAMIAIGGGAGTLSEMALGWAMARPVIAIDTPGWSARLAGEALDTRRSEHADLPAHVIRANDPMSALQILANQIASGYQHRTPIKSP